MKTMRSVFFRKSMLCLFVIVSSLVTTPLLANSAANAPQANIMTLHEFGHWLQAQLGKPVVLAVEDAEAKIRLSQTQPVNIELLLSELDLNDYTALLREQEIRILPSKNARSENLKQVQKGEHYYADEWVTEVITLDKVCSHKILPSLRPLVPRVAFMSAVNGGNSIILSATYSKIQSIKNIILQLQVGATMPEECVPPVRQERVCPDIRVELKKMKERMDNLCAARMEKERY